MGTLHVALLQLNVVSNKSENLENAEKRIATAKDFGAKLVALSECFNSPYGLQHFSVYAEEIPDGPTSAMLSKAAKDNSIYLVGGTFPEKDGRKIYNTCTVWDPEGKLVAKYRKIHLFDMSIPGQESFKESDVLSAGNELVTFTVEYTKIGLGICHDIRFDELAKLYRLQGVDMMIYPAAFQMVTGENYFELVQCARAMDNQFFILTVSPARKAEGYIAWGHSQITNPWGEVIVQAEEGEELIHAELDLNECVTVREQVPLFSQRRTDIYDTVQVN